jgi:hypothetical protein
MIHRSDPGDRLVNGAQVAQIANDDLELPGFKRGCMGLPQTPQIVFHAGPGQIVKNADRVFNFQQSVGEVNANEARAARDKGGEIMRPRLPPL